jgi:hypothetical protein
MSFEKATPAWTIPWEDGAVTAVTFLGSARKLAAGNELGQIFVFDLAEAAGGPPPVPVRMLEGHTNAVTALEAMASGGRLVSASYPTIRSGGGTRRPRRRDRERRAGPGGRARPPRERPGSPWRRRRPVELQKTARAADAQGMGPVDLDRRRRKADAEWG